MLLELQIFCGSSDLQFDLISRQQKVIIIETKLKKKLMINKQPRSAWQSLQNQKITGLQVPPIPPTPMTSTLPVYINPYPSSHYPVQHSNYYAHQSQSQYHQYQPQLHSQHHYPNYSLFPHHFSQSESSLHYIGNSNGSIIQEIQKALGTRAPMWGFQTYQTYHHPLWKNSAIQNSRTPNKSINGSFPNPGQGSASSKISMHDLIQKIDKQCSNSQKNENKPALLSERSSQILQVFPHQNPIYSKVSRNWQKNKNIRSLSSNSTVNNRNLNPNNYGEQGHAFHRSQKIINSQKTIKIGDSSNLNNFSNKIENSNKKQSDSKNQEHGGASYSIANQSNPNQKTKNVNIGQIEQRSLDNGSFKIKGQKKQDQSNIKKIKTEDSEDGIARIDEHRHQEQVYNFSNENSEIYVLTNQGSSIHKNFRRRIMQTNPNATGTVSIGVQVNIPPSVSDSLPNSVRETLKSMIEYSVVQPLDNEEEMRKLEEHLENVKREEIIRYFQMEKNKYREIQRKLGNTCALSFQGMSSIQEQLSSINKRRKINPEPTIYQSISVSKQKKQETQQLQQEQQQQQVMEESCVFENKVSKYNKETIVEERNNKSQGKNIGENNRIILATSYPPDEVSIKFASSNQEPIGASSNNVISEVQSIGSSRGRMPIFLSMGGVDGKQIQQRKSKQKMKLKSKYNPNANANQNENSNSNSNQSPLSHLKYNLSASKVVKIENVITSFSELRQIIAFEFKEFRKYMDHWVREMVEVYDRLLMEKEQAIFVLQIEKISLEDKLRDLNTTKQVHQKPKQSHIDPDPAIVIIPPSQFPKIPSLHAHLDHSEQSFSEQQNSRKNNKIFEESKTWNQLSSLQEILSNQIYNIELERYREFGYVINSDQN